MRKGSHHSLAVRLRISASLLGRPKSFNHRAALAAFGEHFIKSGILPKEMHQWLHRAFEKRQISDYEYLPSISEIEVTDLQEKAEQFIKKTEEFLQKAGFGQSFGEE